MNDARPPDNMRRFQAVYTTTAIILLNAACLFVVANLAAAAFLTSGGAKQPATYERAWLIEAYGLDTLSRNYPGMSRADLETFLYETSNWIQEYEPFTGVRPAERHDRFITIAPEGFRPVPRQVPWPPPPNQTTVFLFGGSTMMGAGVPDDATIAAHLDDALTSCRDDVQIYNFGRGYYFSTQERILFEQLLLGGFRPSVAVFMDGLNDFYFSDGNPQFTSELAAFMNRQTGAPADPPLLSSLAAAARRLPLARLAAGIGSTRPPSASFGTAPEPKGTESEQVAGVLARWERNRDLIRATAAAHGVQSAFVWQPVPTYGYDIKRLTVYREGVDLFGAHRLSGVGYPEAASRYAHRDGILWLGDMQRTRPENLYVDAVHYTGAFSRDIATQIATYLERQQLIPCTKR